MQIFINGYDTESGFYSVSIESYDLNFNSISITCYMSHDQLLDDIEKVINPREI